MTASPAANGHTVAHAIRAAAARLADASDTARLDAELLMAHVLGVSRSELLVRCMENDAPPEFEALVARRADCEPIAYIIGCAGFYSREFAVTPDVLIPRADSEVLIDVALEHRSQACDILDLGTGSGALLLSVLAEIPSARGVGIDASAGAAAVARDNAKRLGLSERARIERRDWNQPGWMRGLGPYDLVLCNPPYVESSAALDRDVREHEPASALFAGVDGLDDYRVVIPQLRGLLREGGIAIFEIGSSQADAVGKIARNARFRTEIRHDLANRPRCIVLR